MAAKYTVWGWTSNGFGFVAIDGVERQRGRKVFLRYANLTPQPKRGQVVPDGTELVDVQIDWNGEKGPAVTSALTREEFERRKARSKAESAEDARREEWQRLLEMDEARLKEVWPELEPEIAKALATPWTAVEQATQLPYGATLKLSFERVKAVALDPENGVSVTLEQAFELKLGRASRWPVDGATYTKSQGWEGVELGHQLKPKRESGTMLVHFLVVVEVLAGQDNRREAEVEFPAKVEAPRREGAKVVQEIVAQTPVGEAKTEIRLYENPSSGSEPESVWGEFETADLVSQVDTAAFEAAGIGKMPKGEFSVADFCTARREASHGRDPDDGYWSEAAHEWWDGGVTLTVTGPFLAKLSREGAIGIVLTVAGALDRSHVEGELRKEVTRAAKEWNLTAGMGQTYGQKLLTNLMNFVPEFKLREGMFEVEAEAVKAGRLDGVPHGQAVVVGEGKKNDYLTENTRAVKVVAQATAQELGIPGKAIPGPVAVYWPEGQKDEGGKEYFVTEFADPPYAHGTQVTAIVKREMVHHEETRGQAARDSKETRVVIPNTPAEKFKAVRVWEGK